MHKHWGLFTAKPILIYPSLPLLTPEAQAIMYAECAPCSTDLVEPGDTGIDVPPVRLVLWYVRLPGIHYKLVCVYGPQQCQLDQC